MSERLDRWNGKANTYNTSMELNYSVDVTKFNSESRVLSSVKLNQNSSRRSNEVKATIAPPFPPPPERKRQSWTICELKCWILIEGWTSPGYGIGRPYAGKDRVS